LKQLIDFIRSIKEELNYLERIEEIEVNRDWSSIAKLDSSELKLHKKVIPKTNLFFTQTKPFEHFFSFKIKNLDNELNDRFASHIDPLLHLGKASINENHPASKIFKIHMSNLEEYFKWVKQLSQMLSLHINDLAEYENVT
jgi:hypothetical protein